MVKAMSKDQTLYVIGHREVSYGALTDKRFVSRPDYHKIGISQNVENRLSVLSGGTPHELELVTTIDVDEATTVEEYLHRINRNHFQNRGEWFRLRRNMIQSLKALDQLTGENVEQVYHNWSTLDRRVSFYVAIHKARNGELPTWEELVA